MIDREYIKRQNESAKELELKGFRLQGRDCNGNACVIKDNQVICEKDYEAVLQKVSDTSDNLTLEKIMNHLINGGKVAPKGSKSFQGMYLKDGYDDVYIAYNHYGSSAIKVNYKQLEWLVNEIFGGLDTLELKDNDYSVYA
jgi:hypothetical protein